MNLRFHIMILLTVTTCLAAALPAYAQSPPLPPRKTGSLEAIEQRIMQEEEQKKQLASAARQTERELEKTRKDMIALGEKIRRHENELSTLEARMSQLDEEQQALHERLAGDYGAMADLVLAMERIRRVPPEALIIRPGAPLQTAQTAMLLRSTLPAIQNRAEALSKDLSRLAAIEKQLSADRARTVAAQQDLAAQEREMAGLVAQREQQHRRMQRDLGQSEETLQQLAREASSIKELMARIEAEQEKQRQAAAAVAASGRSAATRQAAIPLPDTGQSRLPVTGIVLTGFGARDSIGAKSQGLTIESRPGALIVSPMGGIVRFSDYFKNYGKMVIIEHENGYHSLIAGLERLDAGPGQALKAGEPIGILPLTSSRGGTPALYYELRHNGTPVDPARQFKELKS